jgi:sugar lactone lactonase YvrE
MIGRVVLAAAVLNAGMLCAVRGVQAQLTISTLAGRQIGDGRLAPAASLDRPFGVAFAADGALLIADRRHHRIRRVDPATGIISTIAGSVVGARSGVAADQAELKDPLRVHVAANGDLLITTFDQHTVRRVSAATNILTRIAGVVDNPGATGDAGPATAALLNHPADAFPDDTGGVLIADRDNHKVRRIDALGFMSTVAGVGTPGYSGDGGLAAAAQLNAPTCVLPVPTASGGGFFVCDEVNHVVRRVDGLGVITTAAGTGTAGFADGPVATAQLDAPLGLAFDRDGTILIADRGSNRIRRLDPVAGTLSTVAGTGEEASTPDGEPAANNPVSRPAAVEVAPDGRIVFAEDSAHRVRAIDASGSLSTVAGDGVTTFGGDGAPAIDAQFNGVKSVARDLADRFIVSDDGNARVRRIDPCTGLVETIAGSGSRTFDGDGKLAIEAGLAASETLMDADENLIISDTDNHRIRIVDPTGTINTLVGVGVAGYSGDGGPASAAQLNRPTGIEFDTNGALYIAEFENHTIRKVAGGVITTIAGTGAPGYNGDDMPATAAMLGNPTDVGIDSVGNVYIPDFSNHRIRRVDVATGFISTVAGTGVAGDTGDGGPATAARLNNPSDVKIDETGALWITDLGNNRIRRFTVGGNIETVAGTGLRGYSGDGGPATAARLLAPVQLLVLSSTQVLFADRDNSVVRVLGTLTPDCTKITDDCRGPAAATCVPGGGPVGKDCFAEFKLGKALGASVPRPRVSCNDGDPSCDSDDAIGSCTFRVSVCLNNEDPRLSCTPGAISSFKLAGKQGASAGGQQIVTAVAGLGAGSPNGRAVAFPSALADRNTCTPFSEFVVTRGKKRGASKLGAVVKTQGSGKDKDKLKLLCLAPQ